jgi:amino acid transporter
MAPEAQMTAVADGGGSGHHGAGSILVESKGLKGGSLGLVSSVVVGMASTAPAYSLAASLGLVVTSAGLKAPAIMLLAFVPMYFIAVAYAELNKAEPDCGTTFTWAARTFGSRTGWMGGWGIIAADVIVMANLAQIAGSYSFTFVSDVANFVTGKPWNTIGNLANNTTASTVAGLVWIAVMTYICYRGIEVSAKIQYALLSIEVTVLVVLSIVALIKVYSGHAESYSLHPSLSWLWPSGLGFGSALAPAVLAAVFIYWGWDTAVATNEEADDPATTPGRAAVISTLLLLITYAIVSVASIAFAGVGDKGIGLGNPDNSSDVFRAIGPDLFGHSLLGKVGLLLLSASILTSASASTQTTILPTARTVLSMSAWRAAPKALARIHPRFLTPTWATVSMGLVSALFYLVFTAISANLLLALIGSVGLMIAFYYGLTGFACSWFYRRTMWASRRDVLMQGIVPTLGGLILLVMFVYALRTYAKADNLQDSNGNNVTIFGIGAVAVVGIGGLAIGVVLMAIWHFYAPEYFSGKALPKRTAELVLAPGEGSAPTVGLPDSGMMPTVIAPDLSNLPPGQVAYDTASGEQFHRPDEDGSDLEPGGAAQRPVEPDDPQAPTVG